MTELRLPDADGTAIVEALRAAAPGTAVIVRTHIEDVEHELGPGSGGAEELQSLLARGDRDDLLRRRPRTEEVDHEPGVGREGSGVAASAGSLDRTHPINQCRESTGTPTADVRSGGGGFDPRRAHQPALLSLRPPILFIRSENRKCGTERRAADGTHMNSPATAPPVSTLRSRRRQRGRRTRDIRAYGDSC